MIWRTPGSQNPFQSVVPMPLCCQQSRICLSSSGSITCINSPEKSSQDVQKISLYLGSSECPKNLLVSQHLTNWLAFLFQLCLNFSLATLFPHFPSIDTLHHHLPSHSSGALWAGTQGALPEEQGSPQSRGTKLDPRSCLSAKRLMCQGSRTLEPASLMHRCASSTASDRQTDLWALLYSAFYWLALGSIFFSV